MIDDTREFKRLLEEIRWLDADLQGKDFLTTWGRSLKEVQQVLYTAEALNWLYKNNISTKCFDSGLAILQINRRGALPESSSPIWSRLSFGIATNSLGLALHQMDNDDDPIQPANLSFLKDIQFIGIQDNSPGHPFSKKQKFFQGVQGDGFFKKSPPGCRRQEHYKSAHIYMKELAAKIESKSHICQPGVINLQSDLDHPIQSMADILILKHQLGSLERLWGKKVAVTWVDSPTDAIPVSAAQGFVAMITRFNTEVTLAFPEGYDLNPHVIETARTHAESGDGSFTIVNKIDQALIDADIVYVMNWPYSNNSKEEPGPENWTYNEEKMNLTREGKAFFMNYEPAMEYKSFIIAAMMVNYRFKEPAKLLGNLRKRNINRLYFSF